MREGGTHTRQRLIDLTRERGGGSIVLDGFLKSKISLLGMICLPQWHATNSSVAFRYDLSSSVGMQLKVVTDYDRPQ